MPKRLLILSLLGLGLSGPLSAADELLKELAQKAMVNNPDVLSHWHDFKAATKEINVARGGYFPKVDLSSNAGNEQLTTPLAQFQPISSSFYRDTTTVTLTQMLYDGFITRDEVRRLNHVQLSRYFEWSDAMENSALETSQAYFDLMRHRALYRLSEDNFVSHRVVYEQIQLKVKAGVGRAVDLEQAKGRLALSESNLVTDNANVHDVNARLLRLVNEAPSTEGPARDATGSPDELVKLVPKNAAVAQLASAIENNPGVLAAVENVKAAQSDLDERRGKYQPRVDLVLSQSRGQNAGGVLGENRDAVAQVVMSWNLFSGGSDAARSDQYMEHLLAARSKRDKVCRDVRQAVDLAYHGVWTMTEQLSFLEQRQKAIEKARYAYKKQFDLGQRSLLDLLDSENELFQAKRAYINAVYDRAINVSKMLAGTGKLVSALGLTRLDAGDVGDAPVEGVERPEACPAEASASMQDRKDELIQSALEQLKPINASTIANTPVPTMTPLEPAAAPAVETGVGGQTPQGGLSPQAPEIIKVPAPKAEAKAAAKPAAQAKPGPKSKSEANKKKHKKKRKHKTRPDHAQPPTSGEAGSSVR